MTLKRIVFTAVICVLFAASAWAGERQSGVWQPLAPGVMVRAETVPGGVSLSVKAQGAEGREWVAKSLIEPALERARQLRDKSDAEDTPTLGTRVEALESRLASARRPPGPDRPQCYVILGPGVTFYNGSTYAMADGAVDTCDETYVWADAYAYVGNSIGTNGIQMYRWDDGLGYAEAFASVSTQGSVPCAFADDYVDDGDFLHYRYALSGTCSFI